MRRFVFIACIMAASAAQATTWHVPGDDSGACTLINPSCASIGAAIGAAVDEDTIQLAAGTYAESNLRVDKSLTIAGAGPESTFVVPSGVAFHVEADDVAFADLTIRNGTDAIRLGPVATAISGLRVRHVHFTDNTSDGIEIGTTTVTDTEITDCEFVRNVNGIRMASRSIVDGLTIRDSRFHANSTIGVYQANDGNTSQLRNMLVTGSTFAEHGFAAIYAEEIRDATIEGNGFANNARGIQIFKGYSGSGVAVGNVLLRDNDFVDTEGFAILAFIFSVGLSGAIDIDGNRFADDVGVMTFPSAKIDVRLHSALTHAPVRITGNRLAFSGAFAATDGAYGISVRGNGPVEIVGNVLDGGNVGGTSVPPSAGIFLRSTDASFGAMPATTAVSVECNRIGGFEQGVTVYDPVNGAYGGLPSGAAVTLMSNTIVGNASAGVANGAASPLLAAADNWWGCAAGPGNLGCDAVIGAVDAHPAAEAVPACVPCGADSECDDGDPCTHDRCAESGVCANAAEPRDESTCEVATRTSLRLSRSAASAARNRLVWKWAGDGAAASAFGAPMTDTDYALCIYDTAAAVPHLSIPLAVPAGSDWHALPVQGIRYTNRTGSTDGVKAMRLHTNARGRTTLALRGRGAFLPLPPPLSSSQYFAQDPAVVVQLVNSDGGCWTSTLPASGARKNNSAVADLRAGD